MTQFTRRDFLIATGAAAITGPWVHTAHAAEFEFKFGTNLPATHPLSARLIEAAKAIKEQTDGKLNIRVFPNNQLGGDPAMFTQLRSGALEFFTVSGANALSSLVPKAALSGVGFAFKSYDQVWQGMDGDLGKHIRAQITGAGLVVMDRIWDNGFRQITNNVKPITSVADLSGMKIRVPIGKLWISLFESLGAAPSGISFNEVYSALQTRVVDGQENPLAIASVVSPHTSRSVSATCASGAIAIDHPSRDFNLPITASIVDRRFARSTSNSWPGSEPSPYDCSTAV